MTKSRMIYLGVFVISIAVLIWDRSTQNQSDRLTQSVQAQRIGVSEKRQTKVQADWDLTPGVLNILSQNNHSEHWQDEQNRTHRNLFALSRQFRDLIEIEPAHAASPGTKTDKPLDAVQLAKQLQLTSILVGPNQSCALINGQIIFVGQNIGPFRLMQIHKDAVLLQREKVLILLSINKL